MRVKRLSDIVDRSAGVWVALVIYALGGVYMLGFWTLFDRAAYSLMLFGVISLVIAAALFMMSRWAWWMGLFTFPLYLVDVAYALFSSVNFVGWYPNVLTGALQTSMVVYLVFLCLAFLLLIDRRNVLKSDRVLDLLYKPLVTKASAEPKK
jgi:uncharacterized membrane protein (DUF2068 family)